MIVRKSSGVYGECWPDNLTLGTRPLKTNGSQATVDQFALWSYPSAEGT
jgi:hypothetical protein